MKKIFFFNILGIGHDTGAHTYCNELKRYFIEQMPDGFEFCFVDINLDSRTEFYTNTVKNIRCINIPIPNIGVKNKLQMVDDATFTEIVSDLLYEEFNVAGKKIVHINWVDLGMISGKLKKDFKCKIVLTRHLIPSRALLRTDYAGFYSIYMNVISQLSLEKTFREAQHYRHVDKFITVTQCAKTDLQNNFGVKKSNIHVILNGVNGELVQTSYATKIQKRKKYNFGPKEKLLVYIGRDEKILGLRWLLLAIRPLIEEGVDLRLIIVGKLKLEEIIRENIDLMSKIIITGFISQENLFEIYQLCDIGVIPSAYEQCSYVAIEMIRHKLLVLASNVDGLGEMIHDKKNGLNFNVDFQKDEIKPDIKQFTEKIRYALNLQNRSEINRIIKRSSNDFCRKYKGDIMGDKVLNLYNNI